MHELSIANNIVEIAAEHALQQGSSRVTGVTLRIGRLSCVHEDALRYSFELVTEGTPLAGASLTVIEVPVRIWCPVCTAEVDLPGIQRLACPACGHLSGDLRAGRERAGAVDGQRGRALGLCRGPGPLAARRRA